MLASWLFEAKQLHVRGALDDADEFYAAILRTQPNHVEVKHLLAVLRYQQGRDEEALKFIQQVLKAHPDSAPAHLNQANILRRMGKAQAALLSCLKALKINPAYVEAQINCGGMLLDLGRAEEALVYFDKALATKPDHLEALNNRGNALRSLKRLDAAVSSYDRAIRVRPDNAETYYNRGIALYELIRLDDAVASYDKAIALRPGMVQAHNNRANALRELRRPRDALDGYERAIAVEPNYAAAFNNRGNALRDLNRAEEAMICYDRAIAIEPDFADAHNNRGDALNELGRPDEARRSFERAIELNPMATVFYTNLANSQSFKVGDPMIARMEALAANSASLSATDCAKLNYALGKAYSDIKDHRRAFEHLSRGAKAKRSVVAYDEVAMMRFFDRIEATFSEAFIQARSGYGDPSSRPIFVLGMPRSGTTLVEQILASHPDVYGAGELTVMNSASNRLSESTPAGDAATFPEYAGAVDLDGFRRLGADYVELVRAFAPDCPRVTDKMPSNFYFLGLIHLALPNARIIHTIRDPADTCVSCFSILFADEQNFTYDLGELGRYYRRYEQLMAHWRRVLPQESFLDVRYENVVADTETEARRLLAHCDLAWDDRCLWFHKTKRAVKTASVTQVRQPIYNSSVKRWRVYEEFLAPLLTELGMV